MSSDENIEVEALEIADLEYEVGGMSAVEPANPRMPNEWWVIHWAPPTK